MVPQVEPLATHCPVVWSQHPVVQAEPAQQAMPGVPQAPASDASVVFESDGASLVLASLASCVEASDWASPASAATTSAAVWSEPWESPTVAPSWPGPSTVPSAVVCPSPPTPSAPAVASSDGVEKTEKLSEHEATPSATSATRTASGRRAIFFVTAHLASR